MRQVRIESQKRILNDFFKVDEAHLSYERFNGEMSPVVRRLNFERGDSVAVLIYIPATRRIVLVNQFKYPTYAKGPGWITETIAGMIDGDESPESAARREAAEETGFDVKKLEHIADFYVSPGGENPNPGWFEIYSVSSFGHRDRPGQCQEQCRDTDNRGNQPSHIR